MKRSRVNEIIRSADAFVRSFGFTLPPFAYWSPDQFRKYRNEAAGIVTARLGWDVTDFGGGDYEHFGLFLFTLRNGDPAALATGRGMLYAEKLLISHPGQMTPLHRHDIKAEDIINRGGGRAVFELFMSDGAGDVDREAEVVVQTDGMERRLPPGGLLRLAPGESVTLQPGVWHRFWAEDADILYGEVSTVNDDMTDNVFAEPIGRFAEIEEDEPPLHLLVSDYDRYFTD
ncbi:MAG: D-lyxose/D-mannose family sugar isomerase [Hyphomicrobiales bacterium]|nr:D-lyxose/D-mannose family sugar isomerase [Hyphomicrobiales bacterium]